MSFIDKSNPVIVTGGSGYIASRIIYYLLEDGYRVRTSLRDTKNSLKTKHLDELSEKYPGKLELFKADLLDEKAFIDPFSDTELVIHTASPFKVRGIKDPKAELVDPALKGTQHVLTAANESARVKEQDQWELVVINPGKCKQQIQYATPLSSQVPFIYFRAISGFLLEVYT